MHHSSARLMHPLPRGAMDRDRCAPFLDLREQAAGSDATASLHLGWALSEGRHGLERDIDAAVCCFTKAAACAEAAGDRETAGDALFSLAQLSEPVDAEMLQRAAELGESRAALALAKQLDVSDGRCDALLRSAATEGLPEAQLLLAMRQLHTRGDADEAVRLLLVSSRLGNAEADFQLSLLYAPVGAACRRLLPPPCGDADTEHQLRLRRAAVGAQLQLAASLSSAGDHGHAAQMLRWAAEQPQSSEWRTAAQAALGRAYADGRGVPPHVGRARTWLQKAAQAGSTDAAEALLQLMHCAVCGAAAEDCLHACAVCEAAFLCDEAACEDAHLAQTPHGSYSSGSDSGSGSENGSGSGSGIIDGDEL